MIALLALLAGPARAAEGLEASVEKRLLIVRMALSRNNCEQIRQLLPDLEADLGPSPQVRVMQAQLAACEAKWETAFLAVQQAKAAGADVAELESRVLAQLAFVQVDVTLLGMPAVTEGLAPIAVGPRERAVSGLPTDPGRYVFGLLPGKWRFTLPEDRSRLEQGEVEAAEYAAGSSTTVPLALSQMRTGAGSAPL